MFALILPFNSSLNASFHSSSSVLPLRNSSFQFFNSFFNSSSLRKIHDKTREQLKNLTSVSISVSMVIIVCVRVFGGCFGLSVLV